MLLQLLAICFVLMGGVSCAPEFVHHNQSMTEEYLLSVNSTYPDITYLYSIGKSVRGNLLRHTILSIISQIKKDVFMKYKCLCNVM